MKFIELVDKETVEEERIRLPNHGEDQCKIGKVKNLFHGLLKIVIRDNGKKTKAEPEPFFILPLIFPEKVDDSEACKLSFLIKNDFKPKKVFEWKC